MVQGQIYITWSKQTCLPATNVKDWPQPRYRYCLRHRLEIHQWHPPHQWRGYMPSSSAVLQCTYKGTQQKLLLWALWALLLLFFFFLLLLQLPLHKTYKTSQKLELVDQLAPSSMDHRSTVLLAMGGKEHLSLQYNMHLLNKNVLCIYTYLYIYHSWYSLPFGWFYSSCCLPPVLGVPKSPWGILSKTCRGMKPTYITIPFRLGWLGWVPWAFSTTWFWTFWRQRGSKEIGSHQKDQKAFPPKTLGYTITTLLRASKHYLQTITSKLTLLPSIPISQQKYLLHLDGLPPNPAIHLMDLAPALPTGRALVPCGHLLPRSAGPVRNQWRKWSKHLCLGEKNIVRGVKSCMIPVGRLFCCRLSGII